MKLSELTIKEITIKPNLCIFKKQQIKPSNIIFELPCGTDALLDLPRAWYLALVPSSGIKDFVTSKD